MLRSLRFIRVTLVKYFQIKQINQIYKMLRWDGFMDYDWMENYGMPQGVQGIWIENVCFDTGKLLQAVAYYDQAVLLVQ